MKLKILVAIAALAPALQAFSATPLPSGTATATIDWGSLKTTFRQITPLPGDVAVTPAITWDDLSKLSSANADSDSKSASDWTSEIVAGDPNAFPTVTATANGNTLSAQFIGTPTNLNSSASANRSGTFTLTPNSAVAFTLTANAFIDMAVPLNGSAYAWAGLSVSGTGINGTGSQLSSGQSLAWAGGLGSPSSDPQTIQVSFSNWTNGYIAGTLSGFARVNKNGFIPAIPEPRTYAMMLAGLGLLGFVARRRKLVAVPA